LWYIPAVPTEHEGGPVTARKRTLALVARGLPECKQRIVELKQEIERLQRIEEAIVVATGAPREPGCPAGVWADKF
jgi:hypothetical protein